MGGPRTERTGDVTLTWTLGSASAEGPFDFEIQTTDSLGAPFQKWSGTAPEISSDNGTVTAVIRGAASSAPSRFFKFEGKKTSP